MLLMCSNKVIAYQGKIDNKPVMIKVPDVEDWRFPYKLFPDGQNYISVYDFGNWAKQRCFPRERVDCKKLLNELELERYDRWEIVKKTNAVLFGRDKFWIDFTK